MKKIIGIIITITVIVILAGCSSAKKAVDNMDKPNVNDTTNQNTSLSITKQSQSQSEYTPQKIKDINSDTNFNLLESIDTTKSPFEKGYYDYKGTINTNIPIQMSIYQLGKDIVGTYYYEKHGKEIRLQGKSGKKTLYYMNMMKWAKIQVYFKEQ